MCTCPFHANGKEHNPSCGVLLQQKVTKDKTYEAGTVHAGLTAQDLTTWSKVGELIVGAVSNPYVLSLVAVSVWNTLNDPTTKGLGDSARAKSYTAPQ